MGELIQPDAIETDDQATPQRNWLPLILGLAALVLAVMAVVGMESGRPPGDHSLEAGFARDMMVHHDQAVTTAMLIRDRTDDPVLRAMATDLVMTQQNQIGQMFGWLNVWGLPATGPDPAMTWMGHPTTGLMPGMATPDQILDLAQLSGTDADIAFLQLMIPHHQAAIPMAQAALDGSDVPAVRDLARQILAAQEVEIATMEQMLADKEAAAGE
ncbi:MAG: DUF305 domain-containing protein [Thermomicrobiales bacterium]|nr:DUF305 domain-containing protein [Thermomicrobiales bacterium]